MYVCAEDSRYFVIARYFVPRFVDMMVGIDVSCDGMPTLSVAVIAHNRVSFLFVDLVVVVVVFGTSH